MDPKSPRPKSPRCARTDPRQPLHIYCLWRDASLKPRIKNFSETESGKENLLVRSTRAAGFLKSEAELKRRFKRQSGGRPSLRKSQPQSARCLQPLPGAPRCFF